MRKKLAILVAAASLLVGCNDGRRFNAQAAAELQAVQQTLDKYETIQGKNYTGIGAALLGELSLHPDMYREGKAYRVGDHYSVWYRSSADGLHFGVGRDH